MKMSKQLLLANRAWSAELTDEDADFFSRQTRPQFPYRDHRRPCR